MTTGPKDAPKPISAGRRAQIRRHVLRFLDDSGLLMNRRAVKTVSRKEIRRDRGAIRWLTSEQVTEMAKHLEGDWKDAFELQCDIGLRPSEIPTLKKSDIGADGMLTLSTLGNLTLKTGTRTIALKRFETANKIVTRRAKGGEVLFTENGQPWASDVDFNAAYLEALKAARVKAGIGFKVDARIGRRTCARLNLRDGWTADRVAALLGDDAKTITEHYGKIEAHEA